MRAVRHRMRSPDDDAQSTESAGTVTTRQGDAGEPAVAEEHGRPDRLTADACSAEAYRLGFQRIAPVAWDVVEQAQGDLLRLVVGKQPAELGVPAILGVSVLFEGHPKSEQAGFSFLATCVGEIHPRRTRTLLATMADAWMSAARVPLERRAALLRRDMLRTLARLEVGDIPASERQGLAFLGDLLRDPARGAEG